MMTSNEKRLRLFPRVPIACAYAKFGGYFGKLQKLVIEAMQVQGDSGDHSEVRKATKTKKSKI